MKKLQSFPFLKNIIAALRSPDVPITVKALAVALSFIYIVVPIDLIPDALVGLFGLQYLDDAYVVSVIFSLVYKVWGQKQLANKDKKIDTPEQ